MDEFKDMPDDEITKLVEGESAEERFARLLRANEALTNEVLELKGSETPDEIRVKARTFAINNLQNALATIADLMVSSDKDSVRLAAARSIWAIASATSQKDDTDPITDLFTKINGPKN